MTANGLVLCPADPCSTPQKGSGSSTLASSASYAHVCVLLVDAVVGPLYGTRGRIPPSANLRAMKLVAGSDGDF